MSDLLTNRQPIGRKGMSLIVVLSMMIAATVMATAVYYMVSRYNQRSAESLYSESAIAATNAGEASAQAWFTYEGNQAVNLIRGYLRECTQTGGCKPTRINMSASYTASANAHGQQFEVFLVGVNADTNNVSLPVSVKLEVRGIGQGSGGEFSKAVSTVIYDLKGLGFQRPPPANANLVDVVWGREGLFLSGTAKNQTGSLNIHNGDLYVGGDWEMNGGTTVDSNFIQAITDDESSLQGNITVKGSAFFGSPVKANGKIISVNKNAYMRKMDFSAGGAIVVGDTVTGIGGNFWLDSMSGAGTSITVLNKSGNANGNLTIAKCFSTEGGSILAQGDLHVKGAAVHSSNTTNFVTSKDVFIQTDASNDCLRFPWGTGFSGFFESCWSYPSNSHSGPGYDGLNPMSSIMDADSMGATRTLLLSGTTSGKKTVPYYLSDSTRVKYQKPWTWWKETYCSTVGCQSDSSNYLTANDWNMIYTYVNTNQPSLLQSGYMFVVMDSVVAMKWANMTTPGILSHNFIFYFKGSNPDLNQHMYGNTATSRVVWWSSSGFENLGSMGQTIYGIIYAQNGSIKLNSNLVLHGQAVVANPAFNLTTNNNLDITYDDNVLLDISKATGLLRKTNTTDSPDPPSQAVNMPYTISLLSPRLTVEMRSRVWGPSDVTNWGSAVEFGRSVFVFPSVTTFTLGDYSNWSDVAAAKKITVQVIPDTAAVACGATPVATTASTSSINFAVPDVYTVIYEATCTDGGTNPTGSLLVWIKPVVISASALSSGAALSSANLSSIPSISSATIVSSSLGGLSSSSVTNLGNMPYTFEDGQTTDWSASGGVQNVTTHKYAGLNALKGTISNDWSQIGASFTSKNWSSYDSLVMWVYTSSSGMQTEVYMKTGPSSTWWNTSNSFNLTQGQWTRISLPLPKANVTINDVRGFGLNLHYAGTYYIDDVYLVNATIPASSNSFVSSSIALSSSAALSSSSNRKPTGGVCYADKNSVNAGETVTLSTPTIWTDPDGDAVTTYFNFHNGDGWVTLNTGKWTSSGSYPITTKAKDSKGLESDTVNCSNSPVLVAGLSSSAAVSSSSIAVSSSVAASSSAANPGVVFPTAYGTLAPGNYTVTSVGGCTQKMQPQCMDAPCTVSINGTLVFSGGAYANAAVTLPSIGQTITITGKIAQIGCY